MGFRVVFIQIWFIFELSKAHKMNREIVCFCSVYLYENITFLQLVRVRVWIKQAETFSVLFKFIIGHTMDIVLIAGMTPK